MTNAFITFIGAGNMGHSLIGGLCETGYPSDKLMACDPSQDKLNALANQFNIHTSTNNIDGVRQADVLILTVKPQHIATVLKPLASDIASSTPLILSVAAGITTSTLVSYLNDELPIVRCMPNTPAMVLSGATGLFANKHVTKAQHNLAESILRSVGITVWLNDENHMDIVTALSGCGPAYYFFIMQALADAATQLGLDEKAATLLSMQTALGAAHMALESNSDLNTLKDIVTSKGGATEVALSVLSNRELPSLLADALKAATLHAQSLNIKKGSE